MKIRSAPCDPELLNRFFDGEAGPGEKTCILEHLKTCEHCRRELKRNVQLSQRYREKLHGDLSGIHAAALEGKILQKVRNKRIMSWPGILDLLTSMRFLVPAAAAVGMIFFVFITLKGPAPDAPPSAIINSFTGEVSSVMILETPQTHQTVIWINET
jgi:predicted anti-sigma-YlaC factor YlaD